MALPIRAASRRPIQTITVFGIQHRQRGERTRRPWIVRWSVEGRQRSRAFATRAEADRYRSVLYAAHRGGELFDIESGEPISWGPSAADLAIHAWARRWVAEQWNEWQPRTRVSAIEALSRFIPLATRRDAGKPPDALRSYVVRTLDPRWLVDVDDACEVWLRGACLTLAELNRPTLADVDRRLGLGLDGQVLGAATAGRFRKVARSCIRRAVDLEMLPSDPWPPPARGRSQRKLVRDKRSMDVRSLPDPATMAAAIDAMASHQPGSNMYRVMTAVAYYAGLRPSEVVMLRLRSVDLPATGWGRIDVIEADISHDEPGEPKTGERAVPIPPALVMILRTWVDTHDLAKNELLFRTRNDMRPTASNWSRCWHRALARIGHPPLRVYDCRHAAATAWLQAGVPLGEVARRLGHSVETLVSTYVGALAGDETLANYRIEAFFGDRLPQRLGQP